MRVAIIDAETTGLGPDDEPITVGILLLEVDSVKGLLKAEVDSHFGRRYPAVEINPYAKAVHWLSRGDLLGNEFDLIKINRLLESADILVAHNSKFDARMMSVVLPGILRKQWLCTLSQWPWPRLTNKKLDTVCAYFGISRPLTHDSLADCRAVAADQPPPRIAECEQGRVLYPGENLGGVLI